MSLQKKYLKSRPLSKVTFRFPARTLPAEATVSLVGDFNDWDPGVAPMNRLKSGEFKITVDLPVGQQYEFRYLVDGLVWENDPEADRYTPAGLGSEDNSVVIV